jgi:hypothetical protein
MPTQTRKYQECPETGFHIAKSLLEKLGSVATLDSQERRIVGSLNLWFSSFPVTVAVAPEADQCIVTVTNDGSRDTEKEQKVVNKYVASLDEALLPFDAQKSVITELRAACIQHLKYSEKQFESGIPLEVFANEVEKVMGPFRILKSSSPSRVEFWEVPNAKAGEHAHISAIFVEKPASHLKVVYGRMSVVQHARQGTTLLNVIAGGAILPAAGLAVGLLGKAVEIAFWNRVDGILQSLNPSYPIPTSLPTSGSSHENILKAIEQLHAFKEKGIISEADYEAKKQSLLLKL